MVIGAHDLELAGLLRFKQQGVGRGTQVVDHARHICVNGIVEHVAFLAADRKHRRNDRFDHLPDAAGIGGIVGDHGLRGRDGAAAFVAHHDDQRHAQFGHRIFDRPKCDGIDGVAGIADDEQFTQSASEQDLRRNPAVRTGDIGCKGCLTLGNFKPPFASHSGRSRNVVEEIAVAFDQQRKRLVGRKRGLALVNGGKRGSYGRLGCGHAADGCRAACCGCSGKNVSSGNHGFTPVFTR